ncbi:MAG: hypothetical protein JWN87_1492 [Frankiales bacterium]|nr:hypothetical protein [Frankiales bacterium]
MEALRTLEAVQRSANRSRTPALNQLHQPLVTAPEDLCGRLSGLKRIDLLETCSAFRIRADDDSLATMTRLARVPWRSRSCTCKPNSTRSDAAAIAEDPRGPGG